MQIFHERTMMEMVQAKVQGVLGAVLRMMETSDVHRSNTLERRLARRGRETGQILRQELQLRHGHGTVG